LQNTFPEGMAFRSIGEISHRPRRAICPPLLKKTASVFGIGKQVDIGNPSNILMKDHANLGDYANAAGNPVE